MRLGTPIWLLLLSLPVGVLLLHLLNRRERTVPVSSLALWKRLAAEAVAARGRARRHIDPGLLIVCCALVALAAAAADPWLFVGARGAAVAVVVDCSTSMQARENPRGPPRIDLARKTARVLLDRSADTPRRFLLLAGRTTATVAAGPGETDSLHAALREAVVEGDGTRLQPAIEAAVDLVRAMRGGHVYVISDFAGETLSTVKADPVVEWINVGQLADNVALRGIASSAAGGHEAVATVINASDESRDIRVRAATPTAELRSGTLRLGPGESRGWTFPVSADAGQVAVSVQPGGALDADDRRIWQRPRPVALVAGTMQTDPAIAAALAVLTGETTTQAGAALEVHLLDRQPPDVWPERWMLLPPPMARDYGERTVVLDVVDPRVDFLRRFHPILVDAAAVGGEPPPLAAPLALAGGRPILWLAEDAASRGIWWGVPPGATDLAARGVLPLVLGDLARLVAGVPVFAPDASEHADLTPRPPPQAIAATELLDAGGTRPRRARQALLLLAAVLLAAEALRRSFAGSGALASLGPAAVMLLLLLWAWAEPSRMVRGSGTLAVLVDASASMPAAERDAALENLADSLEMQGGDRVAVYTFDETPRLVGLGDAERAAELLRLLAPPSAAALGTDPGKAIRHATHLVAARHGGSLLMVTDGQDPGGDGLVAARDAGRDGITVHVVEVPRPSPEVVLEAFLLPDRVHAGEIYEALALVRTSAEQEIDVAIESAGHPVATRRAHLGPGGARAVRMLLRAPAASTTLLARVSADRDGDPRNNLGRASLVVDGGPRLAAVGHALRPGPGIDFFETWPNDQALRDIDALSLRLTPETIPSDARQEHLVEWVEAGHGLVVICDDARTAIGLRGGPLERILPARLEPPRDGDDDTALVLLVDRSGSMDRETGGRTAMSSALAATDAVAALLGDQDRYGLILFDVAPHVIRPLGSKAGSLTEVLESGESFSAAGGTDWASSLDLAGRWLADDDSDRRHAVLISDGHLAPGASGEPEAPWPSGVTLSTVSVGASAETSVLRGLASTFGGRHHRVSGPADLPATLRRETARLHPPGERPGPFRGSVTAEYAGLFGEIRVGSGARTLVVEPRPEAEIALRGESGDALLTFGQAGWGRSALLVAGPSSLVDPAHAEDLLAGALHRVAFGGDARGDATDMVFDGRTLRLRALAERNGPTPAARLLLPSGETLELPVRWTAPGMVEANYRPTVPGVYLAEVGSWRRRLWLTHSPEALLPADADRAGRLAAASGGSLLDPGADSGAFLPGIPPAEQNRDLTPWVIALAALLLFAETASGLLGFDWKRLGRHSRAPAPPALKGLYFGK